ncbi:hypothetical protein TWF694_004599 [Orbilia ellipsospora]|uniref:BTB domain-containing protein n=1 Tax=Orbilia ellipsospora TaxID=2528407 RepID=A0AAV9WVL4_9PEZI
MEADASITVMGAATEIIVTEEIPKVEVSTEVVSAEAETTEVVEKQNWHWYHESPDYDSKTTDVKVFCGEEKLCFDMHLARITTKSQYFERAFKMLYKEGQTREITLEDIETDTFHEIASWIYGRTYEVLEENYDRISVVEVYAAANYLQMHDLKKDLLSQVAEFLKRQVDKEPGLNYDEPQPLILLQKLSEHAQISEWIELRECIRPAIQYGYMEPEDLVRVGRELPGSSFFLAMMVECYNDLLNSLACNRCQADQKSPCQRGIICKGCNGRCASGLLTVYPSNLQ